MRGTGEKDRAGPENLQRNNGVGGDKNFDGNEDDEADEGEQQVQRLNLAGETVEKAEDGEYLEKLVIYVEQNLEIIVPIG